MSTQIFIERKDMEAAGWQHCPYVEVFETIGMSGDLEVTTLDICYFKHPDYEDVKLWSYSDQDFCADYNSWGSNKIKLDIYGISDLPHRLG